MIPVGGPRSTTKRRRRGALAPEQEGLSRPAGRMLGSYPLPDAASRARSASPGQLIGVRALATSAALGARAPAALGVRSAKRPDHGSSARRSRRRLPAVHLRPARRRRGLERSRSAGDRRRARPRVLRGRARFRRRRAGGEGPPLRDRARQPQRPFVRRRSARVRPGDRADGRAPSWRARSGGLRRAAWATLSAHQPARARTRAAPRTSFRERWATGSPCAARLRLVYRPFERVEVGWSGAGPGPGLRFETRELRRCLGSTLRLRAEAESSQSPLHLCLRLLCLRRGPDPAADLDREPSGAR
jgi:hypothetical protein